MGNSNISQQKTKSSSDSKQQVIFNNELYKKDSNNKVKKNTNKKNNNINNNKNELDLFRDIQNDTNEFKEIKKINNGNVSKIITKNYFNNDEKNINFLRMINNNPIKKIKNEMEQNKIKNLKIKLNKNEDKIKKEFNAMNFTLKDSSFNDENKEDTKKINQNLYEFETNNYKYFHYSYKKNQNSEDNMTSGRTIDNMNSEGEFFFDNINNNKDENIKNSNKNNIFSDVTKYELKKNNNNINNKNKLNKINKVNNKKNEKYKKEIDSQQNKIKIKIDNIKYNNIQYKKIKSKCKQENKNTNNSTNNNNIIKIHNTNNNNLLLISNYLPNKINKTYSSGRNKTFNQKEDKHIHKNFSFKNLSNNITNNNTNIFSYKENNKSKINKDKNNNNIKNIKIKSCSNKFSENNYSYNYNNFYINNEYNTNLIEKQKMAELIEKIPNSELKNEIMNLYQKIINYNNEIIKNNKNSNFDYIITFSNNYIKINENRFLRKNYNKTKFYIKNAIKISLLPNKAKTKSKSNKSLNQSNNNSKKSICVNLISNIQKENKPKNNNNKLKNNKINNLIINDIENESIFKKYTYEQYKKSGNAKTSSAKKNLELTTPEITQKIKSIETIQYSYSSKEKDKIKIKLNTMNNKTWKKIINLNEVTINNDKIFPLTVIEQNNSELIKSGLLLEQDKRNNSVSLKSKKEKINKNNHINNIINKEKTSKSIDIFKYRDKINDLDKFDKFYNNSLSREKIIFQKNMKKLIKVKNLLKDIKKFKKNYVFKEEDLIIFNVICLISMEYIIIFKDKEKNSPLFKKKLGLMKKIMSFRKNHRFILIAEFGDLNEKNGVKKGKEDKDKYLGLLIDREKNYNEFIDLLTQLNPNLEIVFLN